MIGKLFLAVATLSSAIYLSWMVGTGVTEVFKAHAAIDWPTTVGVVVSSEAVKDCGKSYSSRIHYQYKVGTTSYVGNRLLFGLVDCGSQSAAQELVNQYPFKSPVTVRFNPEAPSESAISVGQVSNGTWWLIFLMPFAIIMFIFVSWSFLQDAWITFSKARNLQ